MNNTAKIILVIGAVILFAWYLMTLKNKAAANDSSGKTVGSGGNSIPFPSVVA